MIKEITWILLIACCSTVAHSQDLVVPDKTSNRIMIDDTSLEYDTYYKNLYDDLKSKKNANKSELTKYRKEIEKLKEKMKNRPQMQTSPEEVNRLPQVNDSTEVEDPYFQESITRPYVIKKAVKKTGGVRVFATSNSSSGTVIPAGSWVKAKLLTGAQANSKYPYSVLLQLETAYTGPNGFKIPLKGCLIIGNATADLSIDRVIISPRLLSCSNEDGQSYKRQIKGFVAGNDSSNGVKGIVDSKQGKVFLAAVLSGIVKGASQAYQIANTTQEVIVGGQSTAVAKNFDGNFRELGISKGLGQSAEMVTDWYLQQAKSLLPTINIGSGQTIWVVLTDSVSINLD